MSLLVHRHWRDAARWHADGLWCDDTVPGLLVRAAERDPEGVAYLHGPERLTWATLAGAAGTVAARLVDAGCRAGDIVPVVVPDGPELVAAVVGVQSLGAVAAPMAGNAGAAEVVAVSGRTGAALVVTDRVRDLGQDLRQVIVEPAESWTTAGTPLICSDLDPDAVADLMFTSGTTGRPKGVMNSANTKLTGLRGFLQVHEFGPDDVWGVIPPMSHNAGWLYTALPAIATGGRLASIGRGAPERILDGLERHGVTVAFLVPTHVADLVQAVRENPGRWRLRLRAIVTGAAPSQAEALRTMVEEWGVTAISMYGMTECQGNLFTWPDDDVETVVGTVGRACPGIEVALADRETGEILPEDSGRAGEIVTRGPGVFLGYYDDQAATTGAFTAGGWFRSGDLGQWRDGSLVVVGRIKEVILRGGATIAPEDVERSFDDLAQLGEVVAVGLPDARLGERVCLAVTGDAVDREVLREHLVRTGRSTSMLPDVVRHVATVPRTGLGKPQRAKIRAILVEEPEPAPAVVGAESR
jgi:acyl-CoA synthetase